MANIERTYTIPLRKEWLKAPKYKRAKKAIAGLRKFLCRHMKTEKVLLGKYLNLEVWKHGIRNPPSRLKVNVSKDEKGIVKAELFGAPVETTKETKKEDLQTKETLTEQEQNGVKKEPIPAGKTEKKTAQKKVSTETKK